MSKKKKVASKEGREKIAAKIDYLRHEGVPERQAVGEAEGMQRAGRLGSGGRYIRKRGKVSHR